MKRWLGALQIAGSAILLWLVLRQVPLNELAAARTQLSLPHLLLAFLCFGLSLFLTSFNWFFILRNLDVPVKYLPVLGANLSGFFYSMLIVSSFSTDVSRGLRLYNREGHPRRIAFSIAVDRFTGVVFFAMVILISLPVYWEYIPFDADIIPAGIGAVLIGMVGLVMGYRLFPAFIQRNIRAVLELRDRWPAFVIAVMITMTVHVFVALSLWFIALPLWPDASLFYCLLATELLLIAELLPISVAGLGVREGLYAVMFGAFGVLTADAIAISLAQFAITALYALVGGLHELSHFVSKR